MDIREGIQVFIMDGMTVNEAVTENEDGSYTIFISSELCEQKRLNAYYHALCHINGNDFQKESVQSIEKESHRR